MEENTDVEVVVEPSSPEIKSEGQQTQESKEPAYGSTEYNFREMRKVVEEQQKRIKELEAKAYQPVNEPDEKDEETLDEDDFLTVKQAKRLALKETQELIRQQEINTLEDRTRLKFKDYDDVVTEENVTKLIDNDADLSDSIRRASNPYATAYKLIKKTEFHRTEKEVKNRKQQDVEKIQANATKPGSINAVSKPLAQANNYASM